MSEEDAARRDPVCGQPVDALRARAVGIWGDRTYYFCSPEHKTEFARDPGAYLGRAAEPTPTPSPPTPAPATRRRATTPAPVTPLPSPAPFAASEARAAGATPPAMRIHDEPSGPLAPARSHAGLYALVFAAVMAVVVTIWLLGYR